MTDHAVGRNGFRGFRQQHRFLWHPSTTGGAGLGINHDAVRLNQTLLEKREQGQQTRGGETSGSRHQLRLGDRRAVPFRQAIDSIAAELGILSIERPGLLGIHLKPLVEGAVAEVGGKIHNPHTTLQQLWRQLACQAIGKTQNREVGAGRNPVGVCRFHHRVIRQGQEGTNRTPALAGTAFTAEKTDGKTLVSLQQADGLEAAIAGGANDSNPSALQRCHRFNRRRFVACH